MRIISASVVLLVALVGFPTLVIEAAESNETKTNLKINDSSIFNNKIFASRNNLVLAYASKDSEGFLKKEKKKEEDPERIEREKKLERFAEKRRLAVYPKGKFTINASAYTAAADECGKSDGITASGLMVREKETIACPREFPFGTKIQIEGMGIYTCEDRGGAIKGNHIDIYMKTKAEAFAFGRRNLLAEVIL